MARTAAKPLPAPVEKLRSRVEHWRSTRAKLGPIANHTSAPSATASTAAGIARGLGPRPSTMVIGAPAAGAGPESDRIGPQLGHSRACPWGTTAAAKAVCILIKRSVSARHLYGAAHDAAEDSRAALFQELAGLLRTFGELRVGVGPTALPSTTDRFLPGPLWPLRGAHPAQPPRGCSSRRGPHRRFPPGAHRR